MCLLDHQHYYLEMECRFLKEAEDVIAHLLKKTIVLEKLNTALHARLLDFNYEFYILMYSTIQLSTIILNTVD